MAKLFFFMICNVLCIVLTQQSQPTPPSHNSDSKTDASPPQVTAQEPSADSQTPPAASQAPSVASQAPSVASQTPSVASQTPFAASQSPPTVSQGQSEGKESLEPMSPQAASSDTTDKPKGGSSSVCVNTGLFLVGAAVLLQL